MKKIITILIIGTLLVGAFVTNPSEQKHKDAAYEKFVVFVEEELEKSNANLFEDTMNRIKGGDDNTGEINKERIASIEDSFLKGLTSNLTKSITANLANIISKQLTERLISRKNYYLFSVTKLDWEDELHTIGLGLSNYVYVPDVDINLEGLTDENFDIRNVLPSLNKLMPDLNLPEGFNLEDL